MEEYKLDSIKIDTINNNNTFKLIINLLTASAINHNLLLRDYSMECNDMGLYILKGNDPIFLYEK